MRQAGQSDGFETGCCALCVSGIGTTVGWACWWGSAASQGWWWGRRRNQEESKRRRRGEGVLGGQKRTQAGALYLDLTQLWYKTIYLNLRSSRVQKFVPEPEETRKHGARNRPGPLFYLKIGPEPCRPEKCLKLLPGPDADPTIIRKLDPNPAGKTQTRLYPSRSAHIAQQMLLSK